MRFSTSTIAALMFTFVATCVTTGCGPAPPTKGGPETNPEESNTSPQSTNNHTSWSTNGQEKPSPNNEQNSSDNQRASNNQSSSNNQRASNNQSSSNNDQQTCDGCLDHDGECFDGTSPDRCGAAGDACVVCEDGKTCVEGECVQPRECGPDNCDGCCDSAGQCRNGDADAACGLGGGACDECVGTESCREGSCTLPCSERCAGCCDGETCLTGDEAAACGVNGEMCETCGPDGQCNTGECIETFCSDTCDGCCDGQTCLGGADDGACGSSGNACIMCGDGRTCDAGTCVVDPASRWEFVLISGEISPDNPDDEPWDYLGAGDPVVEIEAVDPTNNVRYAETSSVAQDDITPTWNESLLTDVPARAFEVFSFDVWDSDYDFDDVVCGATVDLRGSSNYEELFSGAVFSAECTNSNNSAVFARIDFRLQPQ